MLKRSDDVKKIEEVYRLGKFEKRGARPMKIKYRSQVEVYDVLNRT